MKNNTYKIKASFGYYIGTYNAPVDGYLMDSPRYDSRTGRVSSSPLEFETVKAAYDYITASSDDAYDAMHCAYDGDGVFSRWPICHLSRPVYTIVSAKSGRCTKSIIAACDALND